MPSKAAMSIQAFLSTSQAALPDLKLANGQFDDLRAGILSLRVRCAM